MVNASTQTRLLVALVELKNKRDLEPTAQVVVKISDDSLSQLEDPVLCENILKRRMFLRKIQK